MIMSFIDNIRGGFNKFFEQMGEHAFRQPHDEVGEFVAQPPMYKNDADFRDALSGGTRKEKLTEEERSATVLGFGEGYAQQAEELKADETNPTIVEPI